MRESFVIGFSEAFPEIMRRMPRKAVMPSYTRCECEYSVQENQIRGAPIQTAIIGCVLDCWELS